MFSTLVVLVEFLTSPLEVSFRSPTVLKKTFAFVYYSLLQMVQFSVVSVLLQGVSMGFIGDIPGRTRSSSFTYGICSS